jgi:hypothetical protein
MWCYRKYHQGGGIVNTTRVVTFYVAFTTLNHDVIVVEIHAFWYNSQPDEKFHS